MCCYIGPDILDVLYKGLCPPSTDDSSRGGSAKSPRSPGSAKSGSSGARTGGRSGSSNTATATAASIFDFGLALVYVFAHSIVMLFQVVTLQVAMNSANNALLTLLVSNNFVELKGSIFKRFEAENLFQVA